MAETDNQPLYEVVATSDAVHGWSTTRLSYEPKGAMREYRDRLRDAVKNLPARPGEGLVATYGAPDRSFADVENVALYNLGWVRLI